MISLTVFALLVLSASAANLSCRSEASTKTGQYWCLTADKGGCSECVAGVKYFCSSPLMSSSQWKRGIKVLGNCASIPKYTAIATFNSDGKYYGHAAVFVGCNGDRIQVLDQWNGKVWGPRDIWDKTGTNSNNPDKFYVVSY